MNWVLALFFSSVASISLEFLYRIGYFTSFTDVSTLATTLFCALIIEYGFFIGLQSPASYLSVWIAFASMSYVLRVLLQVLAFHEPFTVASAIGLVLVIIGTTLTHF